ncbi:hypothetical protein HK102_007399, partial [Quaeritorhiza haematococci]
MTQPQLLMRPSPRHHFPKMNISAPEFVPSGISGGDSVIMNNSINNNNSGSNMGGTGNGSTPGKG